MKLQGNQKNLNEFELDSQLYLLIRKWTIRVAIIVEDQE